MKVTREEAIEIIISRTHPVGKELITLEEAYGRVLAENVFSPVDIPDRDKSAIDGYAFSASSLDVLPAKLKVVGEVAAGDRSVLKVSHGEAVFVMTGGVVPEGADAAVRVEDVKVENGYVVVDFPVKKGELVNFKGSEIKRGEPIVRKGERLDFRKIGFLAYAGVYKIEVFRKPRVGVVVTGNEVLEPYENYKEGFVWNSNFYLLKGLLEGSGAEVSYLGCVGDENSRIEEILEGAFSSYDVVVTTGGVSKGKYDFVKDVVRSLGVEILFTSTNIRPGRPLVFGTYLGKLFFGLPGYPAAMLVNTLEFLIPSLRKMGGMKEFANRYLSAVSRSRLKSREGRVDFVRVTLEVDSGVLYVRDVGNQQTSNLKSMVYCDALAIVGADRGTVAPGEVVEILMF